MNVTVFYFSGTGNTKWAAETLKKTLLDAGHGCRLCFIERQCNAPEAIRDADIIGFAFPVYGANMPAAVRGFVEGLPAGIEKPAFIVTTAGYVDPFGPFAARKALKDRFRLTGYINLKMSNNVSVPTMRLALLPTERLKKRMARAVKKIQKLLDRIALNKKYIRNIGPYLLPGVFIRRATEKGAAGQLPEPQRRYRPLHPMPGMCQSMSDPEHRLFGRGLPFSPRLYGLFPVLQYLPRRRHLSQGTVRGPRRISTIQRTAIDYIKNGYAKKGAGRSPAPFLCAVSGPSIWDRKEPWGID